MELFKANHQWSTRPDDERFPTIDALYDATAAYAATAGEVSTPWRALKAEAVDGEVKVLGAENVPARLTHWAFGQLSNRVGAPAEYLRNLEVPAQQGLPREHDRDAPPHLPRTRQLRALGAGVG